MNLKKFIAIPLVTAMTLTLTGCTAPADNTTAKGAVKGYVEGIQEYNYELYSSCSSDDLLKNSSIVIDATKNTEDISIYGEPIEAEEFNKMYKSLLGGLIVDFKVGEVSDTKYKTFAEEKEATKKPDDKKDSKEEDKKTRTATTTSNEDKKEDDKKSEPEAPENGDKYHKVTGVLTVPTADSINTHGEKIYSKHVEEIFKDKIVSKPKAVEAMKRFFTESFDDLYDTVAKKEVDVVFYVIESKDGTFKVNDTDIFNSMFEAYEAANNQIANSGMYSNDNAYDAYLKISLKDADYKIYKETGKLPNASTGNDNSSDKNSDKDSGNSTSWKNNKK